MFVKKFASNVFCEDCKKTDEYKNMRKTILEKRMKTNKLKEQFIFKPCKLCKKNVLVKRNAGLIYCKDCKKTDEYKQIMDDSAKLRQKTNLRKYNIKSTFHILDEKTGQEKKKMTMIEKYGVDNPLKSNEIKDKIKRTCIKKYGVDHISKSLLVKNKQKKYFLKTYGVNCPSKIAGVSKKIADTCMKRYGVPNSFLIHRKYRLTRPHVLLKSTICKLIPECCFLSEKTIKTEKKHFSVDEVDIINKVAIFVDGDYWHANPKFFKDDFIVAKDRTAQEIWHYDVYVTEELQKVGYKVLRFWQHDIENNLGQCIEKIKESLCYETKAA